MKRFLLVGACSGVLFGVMDGLVNGNPLARQLFEVYKPIARTSINIPAGLAIDLLYGFGLAAIFLGLYRCLPGATGLVKGCTFGLLVWLLRVVMTVAGTWMTLKVPTEALFYTLATGLLEMLVLGSLYGVFLSTKGESD